MFLLMLLLAALLAVVTTVTVLGLRAWARKRGRPFDSLRAAGTVLGFLVVGVAVFEPLLAFPLLLPLLVVPGLFFLSWARKRQRRSPPRPVGIEAGPPAGGGL